MSGYRLYQVDQDSGAETWLREGHYLNELVAFPTDAEYSQTLDECARSGRAWIGGGAAPLFLVIRI
jgi:hypothetical protein